MVTELTEEEYKYIYDILIPYQLEDTNEQFSNDIESVKIKENE